MRYANFTPPNNERKWRHQKNFPILRFICRCVCVRMNTHLCVWELVCRFRRLLSHPIYLAKATQQFLFFFFSLHFPNQNSAWHTCNRIDQNVCPTPKHGELRHANHMLQQNDLANESFVRHDVMYSDRGHCLLDKMTLSPIKWKRDTISLTQSRSKLIGSPYTKRAPTHRSQ